MLYIWLYLFGLYFLSKIQDLSLLLYPPQLRAGPCPSHGVRSHLNQEKQSQRVEFLVVGCNRREFSYHKRKMSSLQFFHILIWSSEFEFILVYNWSNGDIFSIHRILYSILFYLFFGIAVQFFYAVFSHAYACE